MKLNEAIKTLDEVIPPPDHSTVDLEHLQIAQAWQTVKEKMCLQQREMSKWILDIDRRPEEPGDVLVTLPSPLNPKRRIVAVMWYSPDLSLNDETFAKYRGIGGYVYHDGKGRKKICTDVIAWMPIPEPCNLKRERSEFV